MIYINIIIYNMTIIIKKSIIKYHITLEEISNLQNEGKELYLISA